MSTERDPSVNKPNYALRRGVALGLIGLVGVLGARELVSISDDDKVIDPVVCEGTRLHQIDIKDGSPDNDTVSGVVDAEVERPSTMTYLDIMPHVRVYLETSTGEAYPATSNLPYPIRSGDWVIAPETCTWNNEAA